jgi:hypothetical protein
VEADSQTTVVDLENFSDPLEEEVEVGILELERQIFG